MEQARIEQARERRKSRPHPARAKVEGIEGGVCRIAPTHSDAQGWLDRFTDAFGTTSDDFAFAQLHLLMNAAKVESTPEAQTAAVNGLLAAVAGVQPRNEVEAMLAVQMAGTHHQAMACLDRAKRAEYLPQAEAFGNLAVKLLRTYTAQIEALARLRRGGEQKVTVEHVHVDEGGQAIVGAVTTPTAAGRGVRGR